MSWDVVNMGSQSGQFLFVISKKMLMTNTTSRAFAHTHGVFSQGFGGPSPANLINCLVGRNTLVWRPDKILKEGGRSDISGYLEYFGGYLGSTKCYQNHGGSRQWLERSDTTLLGSPCRLASEVRSRSAAYLNRRKSGLRKHETLPNSRGFGAVTGA